MPRRGTVPRTQHTGCRAKLITTLKNSNMKRSKDGLLKTHPCEIYIRHVHNHKLSRPAGLELEHQFKVLFEDGFAPVAALAIIKDQLFLEHGDNYLDIIPEGKRRLCERWANEYYLNLYKEPFAKPVASDTFEVLKGFMNAYNQKCGDICAVINSQLLIAICSPLMKRIWVHIEEITEVIYMDSLGNLDMHNTRIVLFLCPSSIGILPLGILLLPCEDAESIDEGVRLLKTILPANAQVPKSIIVATSDEQKCQALKECFEMDEVFMCRFAIQKSVMMFLWDFRNSVIREERVNIYVSFIKTLNSSNIREFETNYEKLRSLTACLGNNKLTKYFSNLRAYASLWAMCCRKNQKHDTNDYLKILPRVIKKNIPSSTLNIAELFIYVESNFENYFSNKIKKIITYGHLIPEQKNTWSNHDGGMVLDCLELDNNLYSVSEKNKTDIVNCEIDCCSCSVDKKGALCKHKWALKEVVDLNLKGVREGVQVINDGSKQLLRNLLVDRHYKAIEHLTQSDAPNNDEDTKELIVDKLEEVTQKKLEIIVEKIMPKLESEPDQLEEPVENVLYNMGKCVTDNTVVATSKNFSETRVIATPIATEAKQLEIKFNLPATPIGPPEKKFVEIASKQVFYNGEKITNNTSVPALENSGKSRAIAFPIKIEEKPFKIERNLTATPIGSLGKKFVKIAPKQVICDIDKNNNNILEVAPENFCKPRVNAVPITIEKKPFGIVGPPNKKFVKILSEQVMHNVDKKINNTSVAAPENFDEPKVTVTPGTIEEKPLKIEKKFVKIAPEQVIYDVDKKTYIILEAAPGNIGKPIKTSTPITIQLKPLKKELNLPAIPFGSPMGKFAKIGSKQVLYSVDGKTTMSVAALENFGKPRVTSTPSVIEKKHLNIKRKLPASPIDIPKKKFLKIAPKQGIHSVDNKTIQPSIFAIVGNSPVVSDNSALRKMGIKKN